MAVMVKKQPWPRFAVKVAVVCAVFAVIALFFTRFHIGIDGQDDRCFPDYFSFLVDRGDTELVRGNFYQLQSRGLEPVHQDGTGLLKQLVGMPGDKVEIDHLENIIIEGKVVARGLPHAEKLGKEPSMFMGKKTLGPDEYWFAGEAESSFDSRYWGSAKHDQIIGRARPLL